MNIIEAVKSGKKFKRPHWPAFVLEAEMREPVDGYYEILPEDLIADDYEVEETQVTITTRDFVAARKRVDNRLYSYTGTRAHISEYLDALQKELGL